MSICVLSAEGREDLVVVHDGVHVLEAEGDLAEVAEEVVDDIGEELLEEFEEMADDEADVADAEGDAILDEIEDDLAEAAVDEWTEFP